MAQAGYELKPIPSSYETNHPATELTPLPRSVKFYIHIYFVVHPEIFIHVSHHHNHDEFALYNWVRIGLDVYCNIAEGIPRCALVYNVYILVSFK
jgi:hypothetical protein